MKQTILLGMACVGLASFLVFSLVRFRSGVDSVEILAPHVGAYLPASSFRDSNIAGHFDSDEGVLAVVFSKTCDDCAKQSANWHEILQVLPAQIPVVLVPFRRGGSWQDISSDKVLKAYPTMCDTRELKEAFLIWRVPSYIELNSEYEIVRIGHNLDLLRRIVGGFQHRVNQQR